MSNEDDNLMQLVMCAAALDSDKYVDPDLKMLFLLNFGLSQPKQQASRERSRGRFVQLLRQSRVDEFAKDFRMSADMFNDIVVRLVPPIAGSDVSHEEAVGLSVWRLATGQTYRQIAIEFGYSEKALHVYFQHFCHHVATYVHNPSVLSMPTQEELERSADFFQRKFSMDGLVGCVDGSFIPFKKAPKQSAFPMAYYSGHHKAWGTNMAAVADHRLVFRCVSIGHQGRVHDATVWRLSKMKNCWEALLRGTQFYLTGDSAYPAHKHLLKEFSAEELRQGVATGSAEFVALQTEYNNCFYGSRKSVEMAFGLWKAKWKVLDRLPVDGPGDHANEMIAACVVLHNIGILFHGYGVQYYEKFEAEYDANVELNRQIAAAADAAADPDARSAEEEKNEEEDIAQSDREAHQQRRAAVGAAAIRINRARKAADEAAAAAAACARVN